MNLAWLVAAIVGFKGEVDWHHIPCGTSKTLDISGVTALGWKPDIEPRDGVTRLCQSYANGSG